MVTPRVLSFSQLSSLLIRFIAEACKALASDYDFPQVSGSRDKNLNKIMQFVGVRYRMVEMLASLESISTSTA